MPRIGLVLGAGGVTGEAFHRGVLRGLRDLAGWDARRADLIVGTSAGSLVGASLRAPGDADGPAAPAVGDALEDTLAALPEDLPGESARLVGLGALRASARRPWRARPGVLATSLVPAGRVSTKFLSDGLRRRFGESWPQRDLWLVAVRRRDGRRVVFGRADAPRVAVADAVAASCAIPGYFKPVRVRGTSYVDGGVHSPTNADVLRRTPLDLVVISSPMSVHLAPLGLRPKLDLGLRVMWHRHLNAEKKRLHTAGIRTLTFEPTGGALGALGLNPLRADRIDVIEELAYQSTCQRLTELERHRIAPLRPTAVA